MDLIGEKRYRGYSWIAWRDGDAEYKVLMFEKLNGCMWKPVKTLVTADTPRDWWMRMKIDELCDGK